MSDKKKPNFCSPFFCVQFITIYFVYEYINEWKSNKKSQVKCAHTPK